MGCGEPLHKNSKWNGLHMVTIQRISFCSRVQMKLFLESNGSIMKLYDLSQEYQGI